MTSASLLLVALMLTLLAPAATASEAGFERIGRLGAESWAVPRTGQRIVGMPVVAETVQRWSRDPERRLLIKHRGGEEGSLWAAELADWLIALGVPGSAIEVRPADVPPDELILGLTVGGVPR